MQPTTDDPTSGDTEKHNALQEVEHANDTDNADEGKTAEVRVTLTEEDVSKHETIALTNRIDAYVERPTSVS